MLQPSKSINSNKMASFNKPTPLTAEQFKTNDDFHKTLIYMKVICYVWKDTGNAYKCVGGTIKPATTKGFVELVDIVSKDFARQYISLPDIVKVGNGEMNAFFPAASCDKEKALKQIWNISVNHKAEKPKKVKKGKKNRSKK